MKILENYINEMAVDPISDKIRQALKANGYKTPAQLSVVRDRGGSYEKSYTVTIKDMKIDDEEIRKIVKKFSSVDYDERTGEILSGGNTYIFVEYDWHIKDKEERRLMPIALKFIDKALDNGGKELKLNNGYTFKLNYRKDDKNVEKLKKGYSLYQSLYTDRDIIRKNKKDVTKEFHDKKIWWLFARAGY